MFKYIKQLIILFFIVFPISSIAVDLKSVDGIWQNESREKLYYSIHQDGNTLVIIDLPLLGFTGDVFKATYVGSIKNISTEKIIVNPISFPEVPISIVFHSDTEATIDSSAACDTCITIFPFGKLKKIFK